MSDLSFENTEKRIEELVKELLVVPLSQPAFDLSTTPANLDDLGVLTRRVSNVIIRFRSIDYDNAKINPKAKCFPRQNTANYTILVNNNNLRSHLDVYAIAQAIIYKLRGQIVARDTDNNIVESSPIYISNAKFVDYDEIKSCHKMEIVLSFDYVEAYSRKQ